MLAPLSAGGSSSGGSGGGDGGSGDGGGGGPPGGSDGGDSSNSGGDPDSCRYGLTTEDFAAAQACNGRCCSLYGVVFGECVTKRGSVEEKAYTHIVASGHCNFVSNEFIDQPDKMSNNHKRFVLYWWFATNIYKAFGNKNRIELPPCVLLHVRKRHPDPEGKYVGHVGTSNEHDCGY